MSKARQERRLATLKQSIEDGEYYSASQQCLAHAAKYVKTGNNKDALKLLVEIHGPLVKHQKNDSAADLALYYLDVLKKCTESGEISMTRFEEDHVDNLVAFHEAINPDTPEFEKFEIRSLAISRTDDNPFGLELLRFFYGQYYQQRGMNDKALSHFIHTNSGQEVGEILVLEKSYDKLQHVVYNLLCQGNWVLAKQATGRFIKKYVSVEETRGSHPVSNFIKFLIQAVEENLRDGFMVLVEKYESIWENYEGGPQYIQHIAMQNFNVRIQTKAEMENPLGNLMSSFMQGGGLDNLMNAFGPPPTSAPLTSTPTQTNRAAPQAPKTLLQTSTNTKLASKIPENAKATNVKGMADDDDLD